MSYPRGPKGVRPKGKKTPAQKGNKEGEEAAMLTKQLVLEEELKRLQTQVAALQGMEQGSQERKGLLGSVPPVVLPARSLSEEASLQAQLTEAFDELDTLGAGDDSALAPTATGVGARTLPPPNLRADTGRWQEGGDGDEAYPFTHAPNALKLFASSTTMTHAFAHSRGAATLSPFSDALPGRDTGKAESKDPSLHSSVDPSPLQDGRKKKKSARKPQLQSHPPRSSHPAEPQSALSSAAASADHASALSAESSTFDDSGLLPPLSALPEATCALREQLLRFAEIRSLFQMQRQIAQATARKQGQGQGGFRFATELESSEEAAQHKLQQDTSRHRLRMHEGRQVPRRFPDTHTTHTAHSPAQRPHLHSHSSPSPRTVLLRPSPGEDGGDKEGDHTIHADSDSHNSDSHTHISSHDGHTRYGSEGYAEQEDKKEQEGQEVQRGQEMQEKKEGQGGQGEQGGLRGRGVRKRSMMYYPGAFTAATRALFPTKEGVGDLSHVVPSTPPPTRMGARTAVLTAVLTGAERGLARSAAGTTTGWRLWGPASL
ncbi:hypothetical protein B484DRAFT_237914 [Ochromonadaceae sp. CCMP2298]|nr:hypothetical protein B484DRAFT_237914 [Ochromonadaceae sp. CCMP2298]